MKICIITVILTALSVLYTATLKGYVTDTSDRPLPEANVVIEGTSMGAATDEKGFFFINNLRSGTYNIRCTYIGFSDDVLRKVKVPSDSAVSVNFIMVPLEMELKRVKVEKEKQTVKDSLKYRELASAELFQQVKVNESTAETPMIEFETGFWEMFKYYIWKMFN